MHFMPLIESEAIFVTWPFAQLVRRFKADGETAAGADHAREFRHRRRRVAPKVDVVDAARLVHGCVGQRQGFGGCPMKMRSEGRRVGKEGGSTCRSGWSYST